MKLTVNVEAFKEYLDQYIDPYEIPGAMEALREASENDMKMITDYFGRDNIKAIDDRLEMTIPAEVYSCGTDEIDSIAEMINRKINSELGSKIIEILGNEQEIIVSLSTLYSATSEAADAITFKQDILWKPIVRCEKCKYQGGLNSEGRHTCSHALGLTVADDRSFCVYGDKEEV